MTATLAPPHARIDAAYEVMAALPNGPTEIARLLHDLGIKGKRGDGEFCPLANYVRWRVPGLTNIHVDGDMLECDQGWFDFETVDLNAARGFVLLFDDGCFPTLIEHLAIEARP